MQLKSPEPSIDPLDRAPANPAVTLFEVPFSSAMNDGDKALLTRALDLSRRMHPSMQPRHQSPGLARLDQHSGLFLNRGAADGEWVLLARTWGHPARRSVHEWHVLAAAAAHQLDPTVVLPERRIMEAAEIPDVPVGRVANKRFAHIRRRMAGLP
jgi:hypothetical protein